MGIREPSAPGDCVPGADVAAARRALAAAGLGVAHHDAALLCGRYLGVVPVPPHGAPLRAERVRELEAKIARALDDPKVQRRLEPKAAGPEPEPKAEAHKQESRPVGDVSGEGDG